MKVRRTDDCYRPVFHADDRITLCPSSQNADPLALFALWDTDLSAVRGADSGGAALPGMRRCSRIADLCHSDVVACVGYGHCACDWRGVRIAFHVDPAMELLPLACNGFWHSRANDAGRTRQTRSGFAGGGNCRLSGRDV